MIAKTSVQYKVSQHWRWELTAGSYQLPVVTNTRLNKYGLPSYAHVNLRSIYHCTGFLEGLDAELLLVHKSNRTRDPVADKVAQNRVDVSHLNIIFNYHFN